jgi:hypothetical protein
MEAVSVETVRQAGDHARDVCAGAVRQARESASDVSRVLDRTASAFEESARLAAVHAERELRAGRVDVASAERRAAARAAEAADRARSRAAKFRALAAGGTA